MGQDPEQRRAKAPPGGGEGACTEASSLRGCLPRASSRRSRYCSNVFCYSLKPVKPSFCFKKFGGTCVDSFSIIFISFKVEGIHIV